MFGDVVYHIPKELFDQQKSAWNKSSTKITAFQEEDHFALIVRYQEVLNNIRWSSRKTLSHNF